MIVTHWQQIHLEVSVAVKPLRKVIRSPEHTFIRQHVPRNMAVAAQDFALNLYVISEQWKVRDRFRGGRCPRLSVCPGEEGHVYLSLLECSLASSLRFCLSHSRRALSCSSLCLFLRSCSRSFSFTLACFPKQTKMNFGVLLFRIFGAPIFKKQT